MINEENVDEWITEEGLKHSSSKMVPKGTILMAMYGQGKTRGQVAILGLDATINQACAAIELGKESNRDFVYQQLLFRYKTIRSLSNTGSQENLSGGLIREIEFPMPTYPEQTVIASLLSSWDLAIEKAERLIAAKEKRFKWLYKQIIFVPAQIEKKWRFFRICDIAERIQRKSDSGVYPILTIASASGFVLQEEKYSRFMAGKSLEDYTLLHRGEFAYNKGNSLRYQFGCVFSLQDYEKALVPHVYVCFKLHENVDATYLNHVFKADYLKAQLSTLVNTGIRNNGLLNISPARFMKVTVPMPPIDQQKQIAAILTTARQEIDLLKNQALAYRRQKRGLMQKLLTGEWRVKLGGDEYGLGTD
jgi:type I restriction enzyme S subunit